MVVGDAGKWDGLFPYDLLHRIFDLVLETWEAFEKPAQDDLEVPITRRFRRALKHSKDLSDLPFRVKREDPEDDFETGEEIGRKDITFEPMVPREEVYFVFECKRLNALVGGELETLGACLRFTAYATLANDQSIQVWEIWAQCAFDPIPTP